MSSTTTKHSVVGAFRRELPEMLALDGRLILAEKKRNGSSSKLLGPCFPVVELAEPVWGTTVLEEVCCVPRTGPLWGNF